MKNKILLMAAIIGTMFTWSCDDDDKVPGNPQIDIQAGAESACFGDSLEFVVKASDQEVPLSTLKAQLYFDDVKVQEVVIRTKVSGEDYKGKIYIPFMKNIPNGTAKLKYVLQNINFTITEQEVDLNLTRPDFPYLTLVTSDGKEHKMSKTGENQYAVKESFPQIVEGYIVAPKVGANGNEMTFGWSDGAIEMGNTNNISFSNLTAGEYVISFNTLTFEGSPFVKLTINDKDLTMVTGTTYSADFTFKPGDAVKFDVPEIESYWIDPDFFALQSDGSYKFVPMEGDYRITANTELKYFSVEKLANGSPASLADDGTGALWLIGGTVGKPLAATNYINWATEKALCMPEIAPKKFAITLLASMNPATAQIQANSIDFKFYGGAHSWNNEYKSDRLSTTSDLIFVGAGKSVNGADDGNINLLSGKSFEDGALYKFVVDMTAGTGKAVLSVEKVSK